MRATARTLLEASDGTLWIETIRDEVWTLRPNELPGDRVTRFSGQGLLPSETVQTR